MRAILERELTQLKSAILELGAAVEANFCLAMDAIRARDTRLRDQVLEYEQDIDHTEVEIEEECLKILALHQPVAIDLRQIITILKINNDLERIGDLAANIAKRTKYLERHPPVTPPFDLDGMYEKARRMLKNSLDAMVGMDAALARQVIADDQEIDAIHRQMYDEIRHAITRTPEHLNPLTQYLTVSRFIERIADHATNIAEDVIYMTTGEIVRHKED